MAIRTDWAGVLVGIGASIAGACVVLIWPAQLLAWAGFLVGMEIVAVAFSHKYGGSYIKTGAGLATFVIVASLWFFVPHSGDDTPHPGVIVTLIPETERLVLYNTGNDDIRLAGNKFGTSDRNIDTKLRIIPGSHGKTQTYFYYFLTDVLLKWAKENIGENGKSIQSHEFYLLDNKDVKYVARFEHLIVMKDGKMQIHTTQLGVSREDW